MLFNSMEFASIESSLSALSLKQQVITQNISNQETPNYKQMDVSFSNVMEDALKNESGTKYDFNAQVTTDDSTQVNVDGNNVDLDQQSVELYSTYIQHAALVQKVNDKFDQLRTVASANFN